MSVGLSEEMVIEKHITYISVELKGDLEKSEFVALIIRAGTVADMLATRRSGPTTTFAPRIFYIASPGATFLKKIILACYDLLYT